MSAGGASASVRVIKYVGRTTDFCGKTLWELVGSLRGLGVGRLIERGVNTRYPEPCYMRILRVETCPDEERRRVRVWVQKTFRGRTLPKPTELYRSSYKPDYRLVPRRDEHRYLQDTRVHQQPEVVLPRTVEMPPLMKESISADYKRKGLPLPSDFRMPLSYNSSPNRSKRIARDGEQPTVQFNMGLGTPASPSLYEGVPLQ